MEGHFFLHSLFGEFAVSCSVLIHMVTLITGLFYYRKQDKIVFFSVKLYPSNKDYPSFKMFWLAFSIVYEFSF